MLVQSAFVAGGPIHGVGFDVGEGGEKARGLIGQLRWLSDMGILTVIGAVPNVDRITPLEVVGRDVTLAVAEL